MTDLVPLVKSHPSARVRQLLTSAELDLPPAGGKERTLKALSRAAVEAPTTNFSGIALGTTVHRLVGAVTLYGSNASPLRLIVRGTMVGAAMGACALAAIVGLRWAQAPMGAAPTAAAGPRDSYAETAPFEWRPNAQQRFRLERSRSLLDAGDPGAALTELDVLVNETPAIRDWPPVILVRTQCLVQLHRDAEAANVAQRLLERAPASPEAAQLRALLSTQAPASSK